MGYILVGSLTRLKTLVYKINGAKYIKVYIKHNGELNPGIIPSANSHLDLDLSTMRREGNYRRH